MEFSNSVPLPLAVSGNGSLSVSERSLSGLTTEFFGDSSRSRLSCQDHSSSKHYRSASSFDLDPRVDLGKVARTDLFNGSSRQGADPRASMMPNDLGAFQLGSSSARTNYSLPFGSRMQSFPAANTDISDGAVAALLGHDFSSRLSSHSESSRTNNDTFSHSSSSMHNPQILSLRSSSGIPILMGREASSWESSDRSLMTIGQRRELELQYLMAKYLLNGLNVPIDLLSAFRCSFMGPLGATHPYHLGNLVWGGYHMGYQNNLDPEPGRCRRTDGKKWRCGREVVPDQKYCERHMHRGKNRRKAAAAAAAAAAAVAAIGNEGSLKSHQQLQPLQQNQLPNSAPLATSFGSKNNAATNPTVLPLCNSLASNSTQFQLPFQSSAVTATGVSGKDYRSNFLNEVAGKNRDMHLGPEQMLFCDTSGTDRGLGPDSDTLNRVSIHSSVTNEELRSLALSKTIPSMNGALSYGGMEGRKVEGEQPLRRFFDDWSHSKDPSAALSWPDKRSNEGRGTATTQLSISIPSSTSNSSSTDFSPGKLALSSPPLKLCMSTLEEAQYEEEDGDALRSIHPTTHMALGRGTSNAKSEQKSRLQLLGNDYNADGRHSWNTNVAVGGPLAEMLQHNHSSKSGLNLLMMPYSRALNNAHMHDQHTASTNSSPTAVLHKSIFGSLSSSDSSTGSSPRGATLTTLLPTPFSSSSSSSITATTSMATLNPYNHHHPPGAFLFNDKL